MNRKEISVELAKRKNISIIQAEKQVQEVFDVLAYSLETTGVVKVNGYFCIEVRKIAARKGFSIKTGNPVNISEKKRMYCKLYKPLKERVLGK